ncbi:hypothetical protein HBH92_161660 [Parastagonospora nodorum]|nr:hypothetical protein HBH92_161660 [Parastagonospora nodorum]KAH4428763.1 hypothetical protein HBH91_241710 [Parastagonospora nodorum]KAH4449630.1 hypothetical protein HBH93_043070 [Parastagonospora nodorum]KAH4495231.1 hypothetical protein HBH89_149610 [Parastagonospora nodorum]KAH4551275.1 hypothetical protein HBH85_038020 [Parastagonospora nodorum]
MDWQLLDYAKEAEDTGSGLLTFSSEIPQYRKDIKGHIAKLFAISHILDKLHEALKSPRYSRYQGRILPDLEICIPSLGYTLDHIRDVFSKKKLKRRTAPGAFPGTPPYAELWEDSLADLMAQGISLPIRLELYRTYLYGMYEALQGQEDADELHSIKVRLSKLLKKQEPIESYFDRLSVQGHAHGYARTPKPASPKVRRPSIHSHPTYPAAGYAYVQPPPPPPRPHAAPTWGGVGIGDIPFIPPPVPEIPQSPTYSSASSHTYSNGSTDSGEPVAHWAMKIFDGRHTSTPFHTLGDSTVCLGRDETKAIELLDSDGFIKVVELPFEETDVYVRLYWRPEDNRARILFLTKDNAGHRMRYCLPLTGLKLLRTDSCLQLCRINRRDGQLDLWARLRFLLHERMVLFYCTAVAMKRQDEFGIAEGLEDFFDPGEQMEFSSEITDSRYLHKFQVLQDEDSKCVRFQATARRGPLKSIPIWTAFVTQYIGHRNWMKRTGATIHFRELHPYVFCEGYKVPKDAHKKYQLTFTASEDARDFMDMFHRIRP